MNTFKNSLIKARKIKAEADQTAVMAADEGEIAQHAKDAFALGIMTVRLADAYQQIAEYELAHSNKKENA